MRNFDEIMRDAESLPGNTLIVTPEEAEMCVSRFVEELRIGGLTRETAHRRMLAGLMSLCGKQVTVGTDVV